MDAGEEKVADVLEEGKMCMEKKRLWVIHDALDGVNRRQRVCVNVHWGSGYGVGICMLECCEDAC